MEFWFHVTQVFGYSIELDHLSTINIGFILMTWVVVSMVSNAKNAIVRPLIPIVWPIQKGTNLTQKEVTTLEKVRFSFDYVLKNNVQSLFCSQIFSSSNSYVPTMNCHKLERMSNASCWLTIHRGKKVIHPSIFKLT